MIGLQQKIPLSFQLALLKKCVRKDLDLNDVLEGEGLTYDHLRYRVYSDNDFVKTPFQTIEDLRRPKKNIPAVSFFSGAGGLDIGFDYAVFDNLASIENNELFCDTLRFNNPGQLVIGPPDFSGNVKKRDEIEHILKEKLEIKAPFEGVFHGGPPCQPFSIAANQRFSRKDSNFKRRGFSDKERGNLLDDYIWFIEKFKPKVFLIENVPGLWEIDNGKGLSKALQRLAKAGYSIPEPKILNAADFGVPQKRRRLVIVGSRTKTMFTMPFDKVSQIPCSVIFDQKIKNKTNHLTREHAAESVLRYMELAYGQRDHLGRVDRLNPHFPSKTVIAGGVAGGGRSHLHPYSPRTLSVRESARLQTFPENYVFVGPVARQVTQVGNAVPPLLAFRIAEQIYKQFYK